MTRARPMAADDSVDPAPAHASEDVSGLRRLVTDESARPFPRMQALFALRAIGTPQAVEALGDALLRTRSALIRHEAAYLFGQMRGPGGPVSCRGRRA